MSRRFSEKVIIPYRKHTPAEIENFQEFAEGLTQEAKRSFWRQTKREAGKRISTIRAGGYVVSPEIEFSMEDLQTSLCYVFSFGVRLNGYGSEPRLHPLFEERCVGRIVLFDSTCFMHEPVVVTMTKNEAQNKNARSYRSFLRKHGIHFRDMGNETPVEREWRALTEGKYGLRKRDY